MKIHKIKQLIEEYGEETTLKEILNYKTKYYKYECPKCEGKGYIEEKYNAYPDGLPDSGWATDWKTRKVDCEVCNGIGYTENKLEPKYENKLIGYE